jgi:hypothetical protein
MESKHIIGDVPEKQVGITNDGKTNTAFIPSDHRETEDIGAPQEKSIAGVKLVTFCAKIFVLYECASIVMPNIGITILLVFLCCSVYDTMIAACFLTHGYRLEVADAREVNSFLSVAVLLFSTLILVGGIITSISPFSVLFLLSGVVFIVVVSITTRLVFGAAIFIHKIIRRK